MSVISTVIYCISPSIILRIPFTVNNCNSLCIMGISCDIRPPHAETYCIFFICCTVFAVTVSLAPFYLGRFIFIISYIWIDTICHTCLQRRVTMHRGSQEHGTRRRGTSFKNTLINTEIAGDRYTHSMTLRLDKDTGRTEDLKRET